MDRSCAWRLSRLLFQVGKWYDAYRFPSRVVPTHRHRGPLTLSTAKAIRMTSTEHCHPELPYKPRHPSIQTGIHRALRLTLQIPTMAIPLPYRAFFLYIEPVATAVGAYYAALSQDEYMHLTLPSTLGGKVSTRESIILYQLANLYLVFALNEALVLRATKDVHVWKVFLLGLLIADFGHLASVSQVGVEVYWRFWEWNKMYWGNLGFVYIGATMRIDLPA